MTPEAASPRLLVANGIRQAVLLAGDPAGSPVLLVHGLGWDHGLWAELIEPLVRAGHRVIAPDLRGMGQSDKPEAPYAVDLYRRDLGELLDVLGISEVMVVGFSLGGMIAAALALGDRRVVRLVLACCTLHSERAAEGATEAMLARARQEGPVVFAQAQAKTIWSPHWAEAHPDIVARFIDQRSAMDQPALHRAFRASTGVDLRDACRTLHVPTLVLASDQDPFVPVATAQVVAHIIPAAEFQLFGAGHMLPIEQPDAFAAALLPFLARH